MANEQDQNKQEKDWAQIIDKSRKDNANIMSMFPTAPHQQATFTERFRAQRKRARIVTVISRDVLSRRRLITMRKRRTERAKSIWRTII